MTEVKLVVANKMGMHARPAAMISKAAAAFKGTKITLAANGKKVDAKSLLGLMTMGAKNGTEVVMTADGPEEAKAVADFTAMFENKFGEA